MLDFLGQTYPLPVFLVVGFLLAALLTILVFGTQVRADALSSIEWLPTYCADPAHALGYEMKIKRYLSFYVDEVLSDSKLSIMLQLVHDCISF